MAETHSNRPIAVRSALALKMIVSGGLLWLVAANMDLETVLAELDRVSTALVVLAIMTVVAQNLLGAVRWNMIIVRLNEELPFVRLAAIHHVGLFFNLVLPSTVGGDGFRAWLHHRAGARLAAAIHGVLIDRTVGTLGLIVLAVMALPFLSEFIPDRNAHYVLLATCVIGILGFVALVSFPKVLNQRFRRSRVVSALLGYTMSLHDLVAQTDLAIAVAFNSIFLHVLTVVTFWLFSLSIGLTIPFVDLAILVPPVVLISALPISIGGWGVREGLFVTALGGLGIPAESALVLSVMFGLGLLVACLPGGLVWLFETKSPRREMREMRETLSR